MYQIGILSGQKRISFTSENTLETLPWVSSFLLRVDTPLLKCHASGIAEYGVLFEFDALFYSIRYSYVKMLRNVLHYPLKILSDI